LRYTSFVLRLWQPDNHRGTTETRFRGQIEHVQSGAVARVQCPEDVTQFVNEHLSAGPATDGARAGPGSEEHGP
jgi:hypothetical protein